MLTCHDREYVESVRATQDMSEEQLREFSEKFDGVYFHQVRHSLPLWPMPLRVCERVCALSGNVRRGVLGCRMRRAACRRDTDVQHSQWLRRHQV